MYDIFRIIKILNKNKNVKSINIQEYIMYVLDL